ncbi:hypothetical protein [Vibrio sp. Hal054]|uniref:hypothetical protein n=1 Tax=Vibrio sp. Hal054 TaxID=3035158 RepID=UPI00301E1C29
MITKKTSPDRLIRDVQKTLALPTPPEYIISNGKVESGQYRVESFDLPAVAGYWSASHDMQSKGTVLKAGKTTIMSTTPLEVESHVMAQYSAKGRVVIAGLGLAMITMSLLKKKSVTKVTVLEIDEAIISLYPDILAEQEQEIWKGAVASGRLNIVQADCTKPLPLDVIEKIGKVNYMWCDVWNNLGSNEAMPITELLCAQLKPQQCDWWGWELFVAIEAIKFNITSKAKNNYALSNKVMQALKEKSPIPLSLYNLDAKAFKLMSMLVFIAAKQTAILEKQSEKRRVKVF